MARLTCHGPVNYEDRDGAQWGAEERVKGGDEQPGDFTRYEVLDIIPNRLSKDEEHQ
ncbi:MAG TPA: hypothetical protein VK841_16990 [Polyangiaceae bacterium]|nr:hypothetical protein [Polyangiaceae bacterium]